MKRGKVHGFTIIELLLATTVFSLVMLGALVGFLQTGRLFYKGVSVTQTQATAKQIMDDITSSLNDTTTSRVSSGPQTGNGYSYYCVGGVRYTYNSNPNKVLDLAASHDWSANANYGLLRDSITGCAAPCDSSCPAGTVAFNNAVEMLSDRMRLSTFSIGLPSGNLFTVNITLAYGDNASLTGSPPTCAGSPQDQQFCAVSSLATSASTGF